MIRFNAIVLSVLFLLALPSCTGEDFSFDDDFTPDPTIPERSYWGALAVSQERDGTWAAALSADWETQDAAEQKALIECRNEGGTDCEVETLFLSGSCLAFSVKDSSNGWSVVINFFGDLAEAENDSIANCEEATGAQCSLRLSGCNTESDDFSTLGPRYLSQSTIGSGNQRPGNQEPGNQEPGNQRPGNQEPDRIYWGAIAVGEVPTGLLFDIVVNATAGSQQGAESTVLNICRNRGGTNCQAFSCGNCCLAAAAAKDSTGIHWAVDFGTSLSIAENRAVTTCNSLSTNRCSVQLSDCTSQAGGRVL